MGYEAGPPGNLDQVELQFRRLAALAHPDRGGSAERMQQLIRARAQARRQLSP
jgi:DnaJ-domain-containing protein 1